MKRGRSVPAWEPEEHLICIRRSITNASLRRRAVGSPSELELGPHPALGDLAPRRRDTVEYDQLPSHVFKLPPGLGRRVKDAVVEDLQPQPVSAYVDGDLDGSTLGIATVLVAVGDDLRDRQGDALPHLIGNLVRELVDDGPGLCGCGRAAGNRLLESHTPTPPWEDRGTSLMFCPDRRSPHPECRSGGWQDRTTF